MIHKKYNVLKVEQDQIAIKNYANLAIQMEGHVSMAFVIV